MADFSSLRAWHLRPTRPRSGVGARVCTAFILLIMSSLTFPGLVAADQEGQRLQQSRQLADALGKQLKSRLMNAMKTQGPAAALDVCKLDAPLVASQLSSPEVRVGRTALRVRNPANIASPVERMVLQEFAASRDSASSSQETFLLGADGSATYMRAIPMAAPCTICHGKNITPSVSGQIAILYPDDEATGFELGELRGSFVVHWRSQQLD